MTDAIFVYNRHIIARGELAAIPQKGNFIELQTHLEIYVVEDVMHQVLRSGDICVIIYLDDPDKETEQRLRNYK